MPTITHAADREIEWIQTLIQRIPAVEEDLQAIGEALAELDWYVARKNPG